MYKKIKTFSYIDNKIKTFIICSKKINSGSYNNIYNIKSTGTSKEFTKKKLIIRLSSSNNENTFVIEINGLKTQHKLQNKIENIGKIYDYGIIHSSKPNKTLQYSISQKYGKSLEFMLKNKKLNNIKEEKIKKFAKKFLKTITKIHQNSFVHLDLKPENILLNLKNELLNFVIIDFGASKKITNNKSIILNGQMASKAYSPPELKKRNFGRKTDIWAFGIILYLIIINSDFLSSFSQNVFINNDNKILKENIKKNITKLNISKEFKEFLLLIFIINSEKRINCKKLLQHKLFK